MERDNGNELTVSYILNSRSDSAELYWMDGTEKHRIARDSGHDTFSLTLNGRDTYIVLTGQSFRGSLQISVE